jgi:acyl dehydratase
MLQPGDTVGTSDYTEITQDMVTTFANVTGDTQWIHVDPERARTDLPGGKTLAHGLMVLGFFPTWLRAMKPQLPLPRPKRTLNYGYNKVRFSSPIQTGSRVRATIKLLAIEPKGTGNNIVFEFVVTKEGDDKPVVIAEFITHWAN